jgi:hypothetical protein
MRGELGSGIGRTLAVAELAALDEHVRDRRGNAFSVDAAKNRVLAATGSAVRGSASRATASTTTRPSGRTAT